MTAFLSGGFVAIVQIVFNLINNRKQSKSLQNQALMLLLYDKIQYLCNYAIAENRISTEQLRVIRDMHSVYHQLGGNGYLDDLMQRVADLPIG